MISGIMKSSFVDYPGEVAFVIFLGGCNFMCPFCHNRSVVLKETDIIQTEDVLDLLRKRKKLIDAVVVSGGEPTLYDEKLVHLIEKLKEMKFLVKLDTNGTKPQVIKKLLDKSLLDYIAMDVKNSFSKYDETSGVKVDLEKIEESIKLIEESGVDYQFRTTLNATMHTKDDIEEIKSYLKKPNELVLQEYKYSSEQLVDKDFGKFEEK